MCTNTLNYVHRGVIQGPCLTYVSNNSFIIFHNIFVFVNSSFVQLRLTLYNPWTVACQASLSITNSWSLFKLVCIDSVMPCSHLILCLPLLFPPSILPSIRVFSNESVLRIRWPKYWSLASASSFQWIFRTDFFRTDWLNLLSVQGTLKSIIQHHSSKASILPHSAFFVVQLTSIHDCWKDHSLD